MEEIPPKRPCLGETNYSLCIICQKPGGKLVTIPKKESYARYLECLHLRSSNGESEFVDISGRLPDDPIELSEVEASWHRTCYQTTTHPYYRGKKRPFSEANESSVQDLSSFEGTNSCTCIFCSKENAEELRLAKPSVSAKIIKFIENSDNQQWKDALRPPNAGDAHVMTIKYHVTCYVKYLQRQSLELDKTVTRESADREFFTWVSDQLSSGAVYSIDNLIKKYEEILQCHQIESVQITERILKRMLIENITAVELLFSRLNRRHFEIVYSARTACHSVLERENFKTHLSVTAKLCREELLERNHTFNGHFQGSAKELFPNTHALLQMILNGSESSEGDSSTHRDIAANTITQLVKYNTRRKKCENATRMRHDVSNDSPVAIYLAMKVHGQSQSKDVVNKLHQLGLCVSYDRLSQISKDLANAVITMMDNEGAPVPPNLRYGLFTLGSTDNYDVNPKNRDATESFHGTMISLVQQPTVENRGNLRSSVQYYEHRHSSRIGNLPAFYTDIQECEATLGDRRVPKLETSCMLTEVKTEDRVQFGPHLPTEDDWMNNASEMLKKSNLGEEDVISWSAYHAKTQPRNVEILPVVSAMLPLFKNKSYSPPMMHHAMIQVKKATEHLNPGQTPCITCDQPLFATMKSIQWHPDTSDDLREDKYLVMMGPLHIEMLIIRMIGDWLSGSGWIDALVNAEVVTCGRADGVLKAAHITRARYCHEMSAIVLAELEQLAYANYIAGVEDRDQAPTYQQWKTNKLTNAQFKYWHTVMVLEKLLLKFVRSIRSGDFALYIEALSQILPWCFILNHHNYSRWLSVHVRDMLAIQVRHPDLHDKFMKGMFVVNKTNNPFSMIGIDHHHEQGNRIISESGGSIAHTEDCVLKEFLIAGPEKARLIMEFEEEMSPTKVTSTHHHDESLSVQKSYYKQVQNLCAEILKQGNPFSDDATDICHLYDKRVCAPEINECVLSADKKGKELYEQFVTERFVDRTSPLSATISANKLRLPGNQPKERKQKVPKVAQDNVQILGKLCISMNTSDSNVERLFEHENADVPPALSKNGKLRDGQKSSLISCIECSTPNPPQDVAMMLIDGAATVHSLKPGNSVTFRDYATEVFLPFLECQLNFVKRIDVIWDVYLENSLKETTRIRRGCGMRIKVTENGK